MPLYQCLLLTQHRPKLSQDPGFSLTELLIGAAISIMVITAGGWGIISVLNRSQINNVQGERRKELNRSLDFITTEIRHASTVLAADTSDLKNLPSGISNPVAVLRLVNPALSEPVVYYTASPAAGNKAWRGPKVIYRWGPSINEKGQYDGTWIHQPVLDAIDDGTASVTCPVEAPKKPGDAPIPWTQSPSGTPRGFFACIDPSNRIAKLFHKSQLIDNVQSGVGNLPDNNLVALGQQQSYQLEDQAFARGSSDALGGTGKFEIRNGELVLTETANVKFRILGSDLRCGNSSPAVNVVSFINVSNYKQSPIQKLVNNSTHTNIEIDLGNLPRGTSVNFTGWVPPNNPPSPPLNPDNDCNLELSSGFGFNSITNPSQILILREGDAVPEITPVGAGIGAKPVDQMLQPYLDANRRITFQGTNYEAIVLFELWAKDRKQASYDLQDLVILANID